jgi:hypothetical protein
MPRYKPKADEQLVQQRHKYERYSNRDGNTGYRGEHEDGCIRQRCDNMGHDRRNHSEQQEPQPIGHERSNV